MLYTPDSVDLFLALLAGHLLGDFVLQTANDVRYKHLWPVLIKHSAVLAACAYVVAGRWTMWEIPLVTFVTHVAIDFTKARSRSKSLTGFILDQVAHLLVIIGIVIWWGCGAEISGWQQLWGAQAGRWLAGACGAIICVRTGGLVIGFWVQPYLREIEQARPREALLPVALERGLVNGGRVIGQWERALIFLFVMVGQPAGIGFLIAAKSVFRFGELKDKENRMEAEYITIGTLMSFGYAMVVAYATRWCLQLL